MKSQEEQMQERLEQMPKSYRSNYKKAMRGRSQKAAISSFCLECVGYQREEVKLCTDLGCPLYPYRPIKGITRTRTVRGKQAGKSKNSGQRVLW